MSKCNIYNLVGRFLEKNKTDDEWLELDKDMSEYIHDEDNPLGERRRLQVSFAVATAMICEGIKLKREKLKEQSQTDKKE